MANAGTPVAWLGVWDWKACSLSSLLPTPQALLPEGLGAQALHDSCCHLRSSVLQLALPLGPLVN